MKIITVRQPWAAAIALGAKRWETRSWPTKYRGPLAIHAGENLEAIKGGMPELWRAVLAPLGEALRWERGGALPELAVGAVVCVVEVTDCVRVEDVPDLDARREVLVGGRPIEYQQRDLGSFLPGWWAWRLERAKRLSAAVRVLGRQGLWTLPAEAQRAVRQVMLGEYEPRQQTQRTVVRPREPWPFKPRRP